MSEPAEFSGESPDDEVECFSISLLTNAGLGQHLEAERRYLLSIANSELAGDLQAKGGASDIVQEVFLEAARDIHGFAGKGPLEFRGWLKQILLHNLSNFRRLYRDRKKRSVDREVAVDVCTLSQISGPDPSPSRILMRAELEGAIKGVRDSLPEDYRKVIELRSIQRLPFDEVAERMNRSIGATRKLWCRAVETLEQRFDSKCHDISGLQYPGI